MTSCDNMEEVLQACGAGCYTSSMVRNTDMVLSLQEDIDYRWWIRYEYRFRGRNHVGFKTHVNKMTSNTFYPGDENTEYTEDWDKRYLTHEAHFSLYKYLVILFVLIIRHVLMNHCFISH